MFRWNGILIFLCFLVIFASANESKCDDLKWKCDSGQCISTDLLCDGEKNCDDGSDETMQMCNDIRCPKFAFRCAYGACVDGNSKCNNKTECADNSDELNCTTQFEHINRYSNSFACDSGQVIDESYICDGKKDCSDASDETMKLCASMACPGYAFRCRYGACIDFNLKCNGKMDCIDGSDESSKLCGRYKRNTSNKTRKCSNQVLRGQTFVAQCTYKGLTIPCDGEILPGTRATISCQVGYKKPNRGFLNDILLCDSFGEWDYHPYSCEPDCGTEYIESRPFVAGGEVTNITMVPWHVVIYQHKDDMYSHICDGTIISEKVVISAAHCFWDHLRGTVKNHTEFKVIAGKFHRNYSAQENFSSQTFDVTEISIPTTFGGEKLSFQNDIAVLILNDYIKFRNHIKPICLENVSYGERDVKTDVTGIIASWGEVLKSVEVPAKTHNECSANLAQEHKRYLADDKFCIGPLNNHIFTSYSGTGYVIPKIIDGTKTYYLWGVVSMSLGQNNSIIGLTNVQYHTDMINEYYIRYRPK